MKQNLKRFMLNLLGNKQNTFYLRVGKMGISFYDVEMLEKDIS